MLAACSYAVYGSLGSLGHLWINQSINQSIVSNNKKDDASQAGNNNAALLASNAATQASNGDSNVLQASNAAGKKNKPNTWNKSELANRMKIPILWLSIFNDHISPSRPCPRKVIS